MKIAYLTAGGAGMYCGSCMHDNTLVRALRAAGHDALLIPLYTPIRTDEEDVSQKRVFFGGLNVYLQQKVPLFRYTPWLLDRLLDSPRLLRWVSSFATRTEAKALGELTISMLRGRDGYQRKEIAKLVGWLRDEVKPDIVHLTNVLIAGIVPALQEGLRVPIFASLQGDDIFLDSLPNGYRRQAIDLIAQHSARIDRFIAPCSYYAEHMGQCLRIPRTRIATVPLGLDLHGHGDGAPRPPGEPFTIGYFARICPEKGLHILVEAFRQLCQLPGAETCRLRIGGWLGEPQRAYLDAQLALLRQAGLGARVEHVDAPDHISKVRFLCSLDVLSVPTVYREPKGLYVLEALANGVPVVQPRHGAFPELLEATGGGLLFEPNDPADLARGLRQLLEQPEERRTLGARGQAAVRARFDAAAMAVATVELYRNHL